MTGKEAVETEATRRRERGGDEPRSGDSRRRLFMEGRLPERARGDGAASLEGGRQDLQNQSPSGTQERPRHSTWPPCGRPAAVGGLGESQRPPSQKINGEGSRGSGEPHTRHEAIDSRAREEAAREGTLRERDEAEADERRRRFGDGSLGAGGGCAVRGPAASGAARHGGAEDGSSGGSGGGGGQGPDGWTGGQ